jgi:hypothetical protein
MKRAAVVVLGLVLTGAAVWGLVTYGPYLRWYTRVRWRAIEVSRREPAAEAAWQKEFGNLSAPTPVHDDNATAVRLAELAPAAGVDFKKTEYPPSQVAMGTYVNAEAMKTGGPVDPPPEDVRLYLDAHKAGLDAVVDLLTRAEPPAWKTDLWPPPDPTPLMGLKQLSLVLVARALAGASAGRDVDAARTLSAAWHLSVSLGDFPILIEQLIAMAMAPAPASLARRLAVDAGSWRARLGEYDARADTMRAMVAEGGGWKWAAGTSQMERAARADYLDVMRVYLVRLRDQKTITAEHAAYSESDALRDGWSTGTMIAVMFQPSFDHVWLSANLVTLQIELTDRVLQARALKAKLGKWPAAIPGIETSRVPGAHWVYRAGPDGRMSIALNETIDMGPPLRFEASGAGLP